MANEASRIKRVRATAAFYRKSLWLNANCRVEVWLHLPRRQLNVLKVAERSERQWLETIAALVGNGNAT
jgi:hypothetical protein